MHSTGPVHPDRLPVSKPGLVSDSTAGCQRSVFRKHKTIWYRTDTRLLKFSQREAALFDVLLAHEPVQALRITASVALFACARSSPYSNVATALSHVRHVAYADAGIAVRVPEPQAVWRRGGIMTCGEVDVLHSGRSSPPDLVIEESISARRVYRTVHAIDPPVPSHDRAVCGRLVSPQVADRARVGGSAW